jgi:hypothetical protein
MRFLTIALAALVLVSACFKTGTVAAENSGKLSGPQIHEKFAGRQLTDEVHWRDVYDRDGTLRSYILGTKKVGKWAIEKDELCMYFGDQDDGCYEVWVLGRPHGDETCGVGLVDRRHPTAADRSRLRS